MTTFDGPRDPTTQWERSRWRRTSEDRSWLGARGSVLMTLCITFNEIDASFAPNSVRQLCWCCTARMWSRALRLRNFTACVPRAP